MQPLLSLTIPTWNRAKFLSESLERLKRQLSDIDIEDVEILISDNGSEDNTKDIVQNAISGGCPIEYHRNDKNMGADYNFLQCITRSHGKYIWILGDDDYLRPRALCKILSILKEEDIGLLHLSSFKKMCNTVRYENVREYSKEVSYYYTFISGNIFNRDAVIKVENPIQYQGSAFMIVPFYLTATFTHNVNKIIGISHIIDCGADGESNGGYNFFVVFVRNYLDIIKRFMTQYNYCDLYNWHRKHIFKNFDLYYIEQLLFKKENVRQINDAMVTRGGFDSRGAWKILFKYYGDTIYFYKEMVRIYMRTCYRRILKCQYFNK